MEPLISIIIPIYNVEKYLEKCLRSVVNQTYKNLEIILVDDGSPDKCGEICDFYSKIDKRIKVIHKKNGGLSEARNYGLDIMQGKYVMFIDSDDYIALNTCALVIETAEHKNADIVFVSYSLCDNDNFKFNDLKRVKAKKISKKKALKSILTNSSTKSGQAIYQMAWGKLYSKNLFKEIRYPVGKIHEDEFVIYKLIDMSKNCMVINKKLYAYRQRDDSIMGKEQIKVKAITDAIEAFEERWEYFKKKPKDNNEKFAYLFLIAKYITSYRQLKKINDKENIYEIDKKINEINYKLLLKTVNCAMFYKVILALFKYKVLFQNKYKV